MRLVGLMVMSFMVLQGCAGPGLFGCKANHENPEVAAMMSSVCGGSRPAAFDLGVMFEEGQRVEKDIPRALSYYRWAASPTSGQTYIYVPAAGKVAGYTLPVNTGPSLPGHAGAQYRLGLLYEAGTTGKPNPKKARRYYEMAARQGHKAAQARLEALRKKP